MKNFDFKKRLVMWLIIFSLVILAKIIYDNYSVVEKQTVELTIQYFDDCIYADDLIKNTKSAIEELNLDIELKEVIINTDKLADKYKFRGSPTLLINGSDLMNMTEPKFGSISCRVYKDGVPSADTIKMRILEEIRKNK
jgi:hypothetical protein